MRTHFDSRALAVATMALALMAGACSKSSDQKDGGPTRPCLSFENEQARGSKQDLKNSISRIEDNRVGCQEGVMFVTVLASTLYQGAVPVQSDLIEKYGMRWCGNRFKSSANQLQGCSTGVHESVGQFPLLQEAFGRLSLEGARVTDQQMSAAYEKARQLLSKRSARADELNDAVKKHKYLSETIQRLAAARGELRGLESATANAKERYEQLNPRREQIFAARDLERSRALVLEERQRGLERDVQPLKDDLSRALRRAKDAEEDRRNRSSDLESRKAEILRLEHEAERLDDEARDYDRKYDQLNGGF